MSWGDWRDHGNCLGEDPAIFFPAAYQDNTPAKRICAACTVRDLCLEYAVTENIQTGIWGGVSVTRRRAIRSERYRAAS